MKSLPFLKRLAALIDGVSHRSEPRRVCRTCSNTRFERMPRLTFMQMQVMPFFNVYPWRCVICGRTIIRTLRSNSQDRGDWG